MKIHGIRLLDHSPDLKQLIEEGYELEIKGGYALVHHIPYVTSSKKIDYGTLVCSLTLCGEATTRPSDHIMSFIGKMPCDKEGVEIASLVLDHQVRNYGDGIVIQHRFSNKPSEGYANYYEKFKRYAEIISAPAISMDSSVRVNTFKSWDTDYNSVFVYQDTNSSRAGIGAISEKMSGQKVAIVGLGGTGSYILDFMAKTPVSEIHLYDGDIFKQHNAFRAPGAVADATLEEYKKKVDHFTQVYSCMHTKIIPHSYYLTCSVMHELDPMTFVFVSMDCTQEKKDIIEYLLSKNIPFIDTGIGLSCINEKMGGLVRTTTILPDNVQKKEVVEKYIPLEVDPIEDIYKSNIQIAELNALNAVYAVINYKKYIGVYQDYRTNYHSVYSIDVGEIMNEDRVFNS